MRMRTLMRWVRALRSGKFKQGRMYLEADGKYCCLGVLCKIEGLPVRGFQGAKRALPTIDDCQQLDLDKNLIDILVDKNDAGKYSYYTGKYLHRNSFYQIADYIEKNKEKFTNGKRKKYRERNSSK